MKAIILAAGRGSRMKHLTDNRPKCLVELKGKALLDWQLDSLNEAGIEDIAIVTGYKRELLSNRGLQEFYNSRWSETNMVSSLACASPWLQAGPCIVSYSDIFYSTTAVQSLMRTDAPLAVTYDPNWLKLWSNRFGDPLLDAESFRLTDEGYISEIGSQPNSVDEVQGQYMGLLLFTPHGWSEVSRVCSALSSHRADKIHMTDVLQKVIESDRLQIAAVEHNGWWGEIDSQEDLKYSETSLI